MPTPISHESSPDDDRAARAKDTGVLMLTGRRLGCNPMSSADQRRRPVLTVLSGPSGVGKGTVVAKVRELYPQIWVSVSCTTRAQRPGERDGVEYHFVTRDEFDRMVEAGELLEHAEFAANCYGTPRAPVEQHLSRGPR